MIITQVHLVHLGHSKMCRFVTQHNAKDVSSFREFSSMSNWPQKHSPRQPRTSSSDFFTCRIVWDQPPGQLINQLVCTTKEFLHKLSETVSGRLICVFVVLTRILTWLQFSIVTDFSGQMLTFDGHWLPGEVGSSQMNTGFNCTGKMCGQAVC